MRDKIGHGMKSSTRSNSFSNGHWFMKIIEHWRIKEGILLVHYLIVGQLIGSARICHIVLPRTEFSFSILG